MRMRLFYPATTSIVIFGQAVVSVDLPMLCLQHSIDLRLAPRKKDRRSPLQILLRRIRQQEHVFPAALACVPHPFHRAPGP